MTYSLCMQTISSQRYTDPKIVAAKLAAEDFEAAYVVVELEGVDYRVVVDGHHSIAAAKEAGAEVACYLGATDWLAQHQMDSDWYDVSTGRVVW